MVKKCFTDFKAALNDIYPGEDNKEMRQDFIDRIEENAKARQEKLAESKAVAYSKTIEEVLAEIEQKQIQDKIFANLNAIKRSKAREQIDQFKKNYGRGLFSFFGGAQSNLFKARLSVDSQISVMSAKVETALLSNLIDQNVLDVFNDKKYDELIGKELYGEDSGDREAKKVAEAIKKTRKYIINEYGKEGVDIHEAEGRIARLSHNTERMKSATGTIKGDMLLRAKLYKELKSSDDVEKEYHERAFQRWYKTISPLTGDRTFERIAAEDEEKFFRSFYDAVTGKRRGSPVKNEGNPFLLGGSISNGILAERKWFAKGANEWMEYNKEYGYGSVHDSLINELIGSGRKIGILKTLGHNPKDFSERLIKEYALKGRNEKNIESYVGKTRRFMNQILNPSDISKGILSKTVDAFRKIQYMHMGGLLLSSIGDMNSMANVAKQFGKGYFETVGKTVKSFMEGLPEDQRKAVALKLNVFRRGQGGATLQRFGFSDGFGIINKMMKMESKINGMDRYDTTGLYQMGMQIGSGLYDALEKSYESLDKNLKNIFNMYGIGENEFKLLSDNRHKNVAAYGVRYLTEDVVDKITDADMKKYLKKSYKRVTSKVIDYGREDLKNRIGNLINDQINDGKIFPTDSDKSFLRGGDNEPDWVSALRKSLTQFMTWRVSQTRRTLGRYLYRYNGANNLYEALFKKETRGDIGGAIGYFVSSLPYSYMTMAALALANGQEPPDLNNPHTWKRIILNSDGLGILLPLLVDGFNASNSGRIPAPAIKTLFDAVNAIKKASTKGSLLPFAELLERNAPFNNFPGYKAAVNRAIFDNFNEMVSPGYKQRLIDRANKYGDSYIWSP